MRSVSGRTHATRWISVCQNRFRAVRFNKTTANWRTIKLKGKNVILCSSVFIFLIGLIVFKRECEYAKYHNRTAIRILENPQFRYEY